MLEYRPVDHTLQAIRATIANARIVIDFEGISFMPLPHWVGHFNMRITNRIMNRLAPRLPGFGVVIHTGRTSHRTYYTPVNVFRRGDHFIVALTYGTDAQWVKNVLANGGCKMVTRSRVWRLTNPRIFHDEQRTVAVGPVHLILSIFRVSDFLDLRPDEPAHTRQAADT